jgi:hypothetical protein
MANEGDDKQNQKDIENNLGDAGRSNRYSAEAQESGYQRDDKETESPSNHHVLR